MPRNIVQYVKHYVQHTLQQVATGTVITNVEVRAEPIASVANANHVSEGSIVDAIFLEYWISGTFNIGSFVVMVEKSQAQLSVPAFTEMAALHNYENKKNILFVSQGLMAEDNANPMPVLRQWIKIPRGKQRFGLEDELRVSLASLGAEDLQFCGFATYKSKS